MQKTKEQLKTVDLPEMDVLKISLPSLLAEIEKEIEDMEKVCWDHACRLSTV